MCVILADISAFEIQITRLDCAGARKESEAIPVTGRGGLYDYAILRIPHCLDNSLRDGGKVDSLTQRPRSIPHIGSLFLSLILSLLNKQPRKKDKSGPQAWGLGVRIIPYLRKQVCYEISQRVSDLDGFFT
jgi:hypothetical protein